MTTVDHKRIGVMYLVGVLSAFFIGGMFALLVRLTLLTPSHMLFGKVLMTAELITACSPCTAPSWCSCSSFRRCPPRSGTSSCP